MQNHSQSHYKASAIPQVTILQEMSRQITQAVQNYRLEALITLGERGFDFFTNSTVLPNQATQGNEFILLTDQEEYLQILRYRKDDFSLGWHVTQVRPSLHTSIDEVNAVISLLSEELDFLPIAEQSRREWKG